ncbi:MAG: metallophosphoesterase, partial [Candidatus Omnitrophota bacterium]
MKRRGVFFWIIVIFAAANLYSVIPLVKFYILKTPSGSVNNTETASRLSENKDPYFSFIVISDTSSGCFLMEASTLKLISRINREDRFHKIPIDFVINIGDVTYRGREGQYKNYSKMRGLIEFPVIDAIGNHDDDVDNGEKGSALFNKYCGEREFSFTD